MENRESVLADLEKYKPTHVLNCAGCTGRPNVDWCESNKETTVCFFIDLDRRVYLDRSVRMSLERLIWLIAVS